MSFTDIFIRRPVLALVVSLLILLIGLKAMTGLQIRQYPKLSNTTITVTTLYPGASPDLMQGFITTPISQAVSTAEGIDYLTASSIQGTSTVTAYIRLNYDPSQALTDIMAKVQQVKFQLPKESQDPVIIKSTGQTTAVMYIGFASSELSSAAISDYLTRVVQPLLATVDGVSSADYDYGYTQALVDNVCRPVTFHTYGGDMEWVSDGKVRRADFSYVNDGSLEELDAFVAGVLEELRRA